MLLRFTTPRDSFIMSKLFVYLLIGRDLQGNVITYILKETFSELDKLKSL